MRTHEWGTALVGLFWAAGTHLPAPPRGEPCLPPDSMAQALAQFEPRQLAGHYALSMVSTWVARSDDTLATGTLDLWIDSTEPAPNPDSAALPRTAVMPAYPQPSLIGATDAPIWRLLALSRIRPDSRDPAAPGFRLIDTLLVIGACPDRVACEERHSTALVLTALDASGFRGRWALRPSAYPPPGVGTAGYPHGYFCAERRRQPGAIAPRVEKGRVEKP